MTDDQVATVSGIILFVAAIVSIFMYFSGIAILYSRDDHAEMARCQYWTPFSTFETLIPKYDFCQRYLKVT